MNNVITFPRLCAPMPPRPHNCPPPPLRADGAPLRHGDRAEITTMRLSGLQGLITDVTRPGGLTGMVFYGLMCDDGVYRLIRQDHLKAPGGCHAA